MIALLKSRWLLLTIIVPLAFWVLDRAGAQLEARNGQTKTSRLLRFPRAARQGEVAQAG